MTTPAKKELEEKIAEEITQLTNGLRLETPDEYEMGYWRCTKSPALLEFVVRRGTELAREQISDWEEFHYSLNEILEAIKKELE